MGANILLWSFWWPNGSLTCHDASNIQILQTESKHANSSGGKAKYNASHKEEFALSDKNQSQSTKSLWLWTYCFWSC